MKADDVIAEARKHLKTPFVHQGRLPGIALDCVGLGIVVVTALGVECIDVQGYGTNPSNNLLDSALDNQPGFFKVTDGSMNRGDFLAMRWTRDLRHIAIYEGELIIHSYADVGMVCEHGFSDEWRKRVIAVYRLKALET